MARKPLPSATKRGYGVAHRRLRERLLAAYKPSDPCARCGLPLGFDRDAIQLGHTDDRSGYTGLEHRRCNLRASNKRRAELRRAQGFVPRRRRRTQPAQAEPSVWLVGPHARAVQAARQRTRSW